MHVYRLVSTGTMERMIYEQQMKKVDLSTAVVDSGELAKEEESTADSSNLVKTGVDASANETENLVPFSGFLQPPAEANYDKELAVDKTIVEEDTVLASCVKQSGRWLVDVRCIHDPISDRKQSA